MIGLIAFFLVLCHIAALVSSLPVILFIAMRASCRFPSEVFLTSGRFLSRIPLYAVACIRADSFAPWTLNSYGISRFSASGVLLSAPRFASILLSLLPWTPLCPFTHCKDIFFGGHGGGGKVGWVLLGGLLVGLYYCLPPGAGDRGFIGVYLYGRCTLPALFRVVGMSACRFCWFLTVCEPTSYGLLCFWLDYGSWGRGGRAFGRVIRVVSSSCVLHIDHAWVGQL